MGVNASRSELVIECQRMIARATARVRQFLGFLIYLADSRVARASVILGFAVLIVSNLCGYPTLLDFWHELRPGETVEIRNPRVGFVILTASPEDDDRHAILGIPVGSEGVVPEAARSPLG